MDGTHRDFSCFEENIDTEFQGAYRKILDVKALRTDAQNKDSLKNKLNLSRIKSCDYVKVFGDSCFLIEFTDLQRQEEGVEQLLRDLKLKLCPVDRESQRKCVVAEAGKIEKTFKAKDLVFSELRQKCIETTLLLHRMAEHSGIVFTQKFKNKKFLVVVKEIAVTDAPAFQALNTKLADSLRGIVDSVKIMSQDHLEEHLKKAG